MQQSLFQQIKENSVTVQLK